MSTEVLENTFEVNGTARLSVNNCRGSIHVGPGSQDQIEIKAIKRLESGDAEHTRVEISQLEDGAVVAETVYEQPNLLAFFLHGARPCRVDYLITVPEGCEVILRGVSSTVLVENLSGDFNLRTVSGSIRLTQVGGVMRLASVSGEITGAGLSSPGIRLETVSGDIDLEQLNAERLSASTISGDLRLAMPVFEGDYRFKTVSGDVCLAVSPEARCTVQATSLSGDIHTNLPITRSQTGPGRKLVEIQGGGPLIEAHTTSGDVYILAEGSLPARPDRMDILERIASGELSAEAALDLIRT